MERGESEEENPHEPLIKRARAQQRRLQEMISKLNTKDRATMEAIMQPQVLRIQELTEIVTQEQDSQGTLEVRSLRRRIRSMGQAIKMGLDTRIQQGGWCYPFIIEDGTPRSARRDRSSEIAQHLQSHKEKGKLTETWECKHGHVSTGRNRQDNMQIPNECLEEECKTRMHKHDWEQTRKQTSNKRKRNKKKNKKKKKKKKRNKVEEPDQAQSDTSFMKCPHGWTRIRGQGEVPSDTNGIECFKDECVKKGTKWGTTMEGEMAMSTAMCDTNVTTPQEADTERKEKEEHVHNHKITLCTPLGHTHYETSSQTLHIGCEHGVVRFDGERRANNECSRLFCTENAAAVVLDRQFRKYLSPDLAEDRFKQYNTYMSMHKPLYMECAHGRVQVEGPYIRDEWDIFGPDRQELDECRIGECIHHGYNQIEADREDEPAWPFGGLGHFALDDHFSCLEVLERFEMRMNVAEIQFVM
jgi:hypothetical protein